MVVANDKQNSAEVERLLAEGLELFGRNLVDDAVACWRKVLELVPNEPRARDYLDAAVPQAKVIPLRGDAPAPTLREQVQVLVQDRRYEAALDLLLTARANAPSDESISRSIRLLKERLMRQYIERVGNLDRVPVPSMGKVHPSSLGADAQEVLRLIDGIGTVDDILLASRLGQFRTLRTLIGLHERSLIELPGVQRDRPVTPAPPEQSSAVVTRVLADETSAVHPVPPEPPPAEIRFRARDTEPTPATAPSATRIAPPAPGPAAAPAPAAPAPAAPAPAAPAPAAPPPAPDDPFQLAFAEATRAYLRRDYAAAEQLFERCVELKPDDARALHNLESLRRRRSKPTP
ncbi:MAG: hypothetical protein R3B06_00300 [Kofleriaceae bacterium]